MHKKKENSVAVQFVIKAANSGGGLIFFPSSNFSHPQTNLLIDADNSYSPQLI
jgi:hypothetical protein